MVLRARARQRVHVPSGLVKVNLGSGLVVAPGWINIDASLNAMVAGMAPWILGSVYHLSGSRNQFSRREYTRILTENRFVHHNAEFGMPLSDNTADFVYSSHMLEHLYPETAERLVREVHRVLKPGGVFRVCVPDLEIAVSRYHNADRAAFLAYFFPNDKRNEFGRHRYMYDYWMLDRMLVSAGFSSSRRLKYAVGSTPDIQFLDNRPDETLYVEAPK